MNYTKYNNYEKARILGARALQISMGAPFLIDVSKEDLEKMRYNPLEIAKREFEKGVIPITVVQPLPKPVQGPEKSGAIEVSSLIEKEGKETGVAISVMAHAEEAE